jgi:hypothetical protein
MDDSLVSSAQEGARRWLLLIHQLPPKPDYLRVKVRRRLQRLGAAALKNSVYVLPESDEHLEDLQWLANEIAADGGEATICSAAMLSGVSDEDLAALFPAEKNVRRAAPAQPRAATRPRGAVWVTRQGVFIDRIASAWLIRRFIDPDAHFKFVPASGYRAAEREIRFDMYQGEYTHVGDRCTFETLLAAFEVDDPALATIAEIVHDIDLKDDKFGQPETAGILAVMDGLATSTSDDVERLSRGALILDGLYQRLRRG